MGACRSDDLVEQCLVSLDLAELREAGPLGPVQDLAAIEAGAGTLGDRVDIGTITQGCVLGYLDLRFPDLGWRDANPQLANWFFEVSQRPSMIATMPKP